MCGLHYMDDSGVRLSHNLKERCNDGKGTSTLCKYVSVSSEAAGYQVSEADVEPMDIERARSIPQNGKNIWPGLTFIFLMQGHAMGGVEGCKRITSDVMKNEGRRITVMMYEEYVENS